MAGGENRRIMEMQFEAMQEEHGVAKDADAPKKPRPSNHRSENSRKIAALYEDAAEYEEELECFEKELEIINANTLSDVLDALVKNTPEYDGDYAVELKAVLEAGWTQRVDVDSTHPKEELSLIKETIFCDAVTKLSEDDVRETLVKRWEMLVAIKTEHVAEERAEMKLRGMKPDHIRKVYRNYHGLED
jgi:hypothetical protein